MNFENLVPPPFLFNLLKHHLGFIKEYINNIEGGNITGNFSTVKELKHLGGSVMDVYSGILTPDEICNELLCFLKTKQLADKTSYVNWAGKKSKDFKTTFLSDGSQWTLKFYDHEQRYVHSFPARFSPHTFRVKANTVKSAILYLTVARQSEITENHLNGVRSLINLPPIKSLDESKAIIEMIDILRK